MATTPNQKIILKYVQFEDEWSEVFYGQADGVPQMMAALDPGFIASAVAFRAGSVYMAAIKVMDVNQPRTALTRRLAIPAPAPGGNAPDTRNSAALFTLSSQGNVCNRRIWFRGLLDVDRARDPNTGAPLPSQHLMDGARTYIQNMNRVALYIRALLPITNDATYSFWPFLSATVDNNGQVTLLCSNSLVPIGPSGRVILSQFDPKNWPGLNGHWRPAITAPNMKILGYHSDLPPATYVLTKGRYRVEEYRYQRIDLLADQGASQFLTLSSRNTKSGPFGGRGRRRGVILRSR